MKRIDIVYILKEGLDPSELIYSLRSIDENFPHRKVWFVGGQPDGLVPDGRIRHKQTGTSKWERVRSSWNEIIKNKDITDDFFLFNDDFFVMKPFEGEFVNYSSGTMEKRIRDLRTTVGHSTYTRELEQARFLLMDRGHDTMSFALHLPFLVNKQKAEQTFLSFKSPMFRSLYGNHHAVPFVYHEDVKIFDAGVIPSDDMDFISTTEASFANGEVGRYIRERFTHPSRFEVGDDLYAES